MAEIRSLEIAQTPLDEVKLHLEYKPKSPGNDFDESENGIRGFFCPH
jgi:hypothetical protein